MEKVTFTCETAKRVHVHNLTTRQSESCLLNQVSKEDGFLAQWVMDQPLGEKDHALGEVVLGKP